MNKLILNDHERLIESRMLRIRIVSYLEKYYLTKYFIDYLAPPPYHEVVRSLNNA
jgi:hypothetical protein